MMTTDTRTALERLVAAWDDVAFYNSGTLHVPVESLEHDDLMRLETAFAAARAALAEPPPVDNHLQEYMDEIIEGWLRSPAAVEALEAAYEQHALNEESYHSCGTICMTALRDALLAGREK